MFNIEYSVLNFIIEFQVDSKLDKHKESALRGILGKSLAITNCLYNIENRDCNNCSFKEKCLANSILYTKLKRKPPYLSEDTIAPIIIECESEKEEFLAGDRLSFSLIILGDTIAYTTHIIKAYELAGIILGIKGYPFSIHCVKNEFGEILYDETGFNKNNIVISKVKEYIKARKRTLRVVRGIKLITPLRFKNKSRIADDIDEIVLIRLLERRIQTLNGLYNDEVEKICIDKNYKITSKNLRWEEYERYSNKQLEKMKLGGIVGQIELKDIEGSLLDYIIAGELLHIGKSTVFGLGQYKVY